MIYYKSKNCVYEGMVKMSSKGRRYNRYAEPKLNMKKVLGVIVAILVIIMVIVSIVNVIKNGEDKKKVKSYSYYTVYEMVSLV